MSENLEKSKVVLGKLIKVKNIGKKFNENDRYVSLQVEDEHGNNERCLLFTEIEISDMEKIKIPMLSNDMKFGRIYGAIIGNVETNIVKIKNSNDTEMILRISSTQLKDAEERATRNPEDNTKKSILTDIMD